ncbi:MAG: hypothetical protein HN333_15550 [Rhodospirillaceae bacterium]|nr:hypothetical protein [Rhodospirillaceae bacterium]MBT7291408.1 hypothetical protein [Rhodospirillaceae bacterium]
MGIKRGAVSIAFGALHHIFGISGGDFGSFLACRLVGLFLAISIDSSGGLEAVPDNRDDRDQDKEFRETETHCWLVAILNIVLIVIFVELRGRFGFHPAHRLKTVPHDSDHGDQDDELHWTKHAFLLYRRRMEKRN